MPADGLLILRDGEPWEPEVTLYHYRRRARSRRSQGTGRDAMFDTLCASVGTAIAADQTLNGICDRVEAEAPRPFGSAH